MDRHASEHPRGLGQHGAQRNRLAPALLGAGARPLSAVLILIGLAALAAGLGLGWSQGAAAWRHAWFAYLTNFAFALSISLGALFLVLIHHATRAGWSVVVRRVAEVIAGLMPLWAVLFVPILATVLMHSGALYLWADPQEMEAHAALRQKEPYLNATFFTARAAFYFAVWCLLSWHYLRQSTRQDETAEARITVGLERLSPVALILYAVTLTFAAFDWLMSLTPEWYSTIYGVYFYSGAVVGGLCAVIIATMLLQARGRIGAEVTVEHYHDLGKLLFAFVVFWGYIAFSQYLLIWYANIPEEVQYYLPRQTGNWALVSILLAAGHLGLPLFGLLSRHAKRAKPVLVGFAVWILAMHWLDMYWLTMPVFDPSQPVFGPIDVCCVVGFTAVFVGGFGWVAAGRSLVPTADPRLAESLAFENV